MGRHKKGNCQVYIRVLDLLASHGRALKTIRTFAAIADPTVEVRTHHNGLRGRIALISIESRFYLGDCGQTH